MSDKLIARMKLWRLFVVNEIVPEERELLIEAAKMNVKGMGLTTYDLIKSIPDFRSFSSDGEIIWDDIPDDVLSDIARLRKIYGVR